MQTLLLDHTAMMFVGGVLCGYVILTVVMIVRWLPMALMIVLLGGAALLVGVERSGTLAWLDLVLNSASSLGPFFSGIAAGKLLGGMFLGQHYSRGRRK